MRKCIVLALLFVSHWEYSKGQLFTLPDTVCIKQPVKIQPQVSGKTFYWGFCSGYLENAPIDKNIGVLPYLDRPGALVVGKQNGRFIGFIANQENDSLVRLDFGISLDNIPDVTLLGTLNNTMPEETQKLTLFQDDDGNWYLFAMGGTDVTNSSLTRIDFGKSLLDTPNSVSFGNLENTLNAPRGLFIAKEGSDYFGYFVNKNTDELVRLQFGDNISRTPLLISMGGMSLGRPSDLVFIHQQDEWYAFATNESNSLTRFYFGSSIANDPVAARVSPTGSVLSEPSSISYIRDCGRMYFYVVNRQGNQLARISMNDLNGPYIGTLYPMPGTLAAPTSMTTFVRQRDNLYAFVVNQATNSLTELAFEQCNFSSIPSSTAPTPPEYTYSTPGKYNVYVAINEGLPDMQVECRQIEVLPYPEISLSNDTIICQGDSIVLAARSLDAISYSWHPDYNITNTDSFDVRVSPEYSTDYRLILPYSTGCIVDTGVYVTVMKNHADAGPDRTLGDGAETILGGPMTSEGIEYTYTWLPNQFISDISITNPVVNPPFDYTYYLEVRNDFGCYDVDTVVVRVQCNNINLPNAFAPASVNPSSNRFGLANRQLIKLNYFRVFDRWGQLVFETTDVMKEWDGTVNGEPAPMGVYVWEADGFCAEGKRFTRSGNVTLLR